MGEALDPNVQRIVDKLPDALSDLEDVKSELQPVTARMSGVTREQGQLDQDQGAATTALTDEHARDVFQSYNPKLQSIMRHVLSGDEDAPLQVPDLEDCQRIAELDASIAAAAGQPVVVMKPGKNWIDVARLEEREIPENNGLQLSFNSKKARTFIVLPAHNGLAIDVATGKEPDSDTRRGDEELEARYWAGLGGNGETNPPRIDPVKTRVLPSTGEEEPAPDTTYVMVGYDNLQQTLNKLVGFDFEEVKDSEEAEDYIKFNSVVNLQERLKEVGIAFDPDFIDGHLAYRIHQLERDMESGGSFQPASEAYQRSVLEDMKQKQARLTEEGWLTTFA